MSIDLSRQSALFNNAILQCLALWKCASSWTAFREAMLKFEWSNSPWPDPAVALYYSLFNDVLLSARRLVEPHRGGEREYATLRQILEESFDAIEWDLEPIKSACAGLVGYVESKQSIKRYRHTVQAHTSLSRLVVEGVGCRLRPERGDPVGPDVVSQIGNRAARVYLAWEDQARRGRGGDRPQRRPSSEDGAYVRLATHFWEQRSAYYFNHD